ncbi:unnamed protein product [Rotaria sp. Silwood2]|nr:unnamed protein product [Rotaria sp. Silwood2]CAF2629762.1 unnamed protein product [Rotaria sp. Silwood2]CAF3042562.1 unnamed protein product [Rotaria sp. Silwood2]CAF4096688.1 unnamed protein product [Rotaria sp. Silwood2]CAF4129639.1 unnamed protein product [Rotaria sp. Silwood2]
MDKSIKSMKRENELLDAVKSSNISSVQRILFKCRSGKTNIVSPKKINVNFQDDNGMGPIHEAAVGGNVEILKLLIDNGANVNLKDNKGLRPLHYAAWQGRSEPVFILLRRGASVNEQSINGDTPLHLASQYGHNDIVQLLLFHQADPTVVNRRLLTSLDLACENGRFDVVNSLVQNSICQRMILNSNEQNCSLHLAAKNGHTDIVRLLLLNGMDINRITINDGTALHVACRNGRYETAKLLLECGIDINLCNSYEQTADEVVIKQKTGNDIKRLIKEFSDAVLVRAIRSYTDNHVGALNFSEGDCITVLERNPSGQWRGFILQEDLTTRMGYFPSTHVQLNNTIINGKEMRHTTSDDVHRTQQYNGDLSPVDSDSLSRVSQADSGLVTTSSWSSRSRRDSPTSNSYRHSAASSIDSGRSSTALYDSPKTLALSSFMGVTTTISPLSSTNNSTIGDARSICSSESKSSDQDKTSYRSSNSSLDRLDESNTLNISTNINTLLRNGVPENEIVLSWLREFSYEDYADNFLSNGYDIQTIVRMTPEDLTAIGITHPSHRRKIKNEIARLHLPDGLPDKKLDTLHDWLSCLRLNQYLPLLNEQNYKQLSDIMDIAWEDLEDIGITRLGHQKRFMLGIKRLKDIKKGLYQANTNSSSQSSTAVPSPNNHRLPSTPSRQSTGSNNRPSVPIRQTKSTLERCNSLENNSIIPTQLAIRKPSIQLSHLSPTRITSNGDSSNYATLRKPPISPKILLHKQQQQQKIISNVSPMATSSFRLPPPLSSTTTNNTNSPLNNELLSSSRTRSLENINSNEKKLPSISLQNDTNSSVTNGNSSQSMQTTNKKTNLQLLGDANLSSSTESTNGIPFANENVGTIKQRSPHNQNNNLYNTSLDTMKRSLPIQFFEQSNTHLLRPSYPMTTAIYDNNDRFISTNIHSPNKQIRKTSTLSPTQINGRNSSIVTGDKRLQYIEIIKKDKQNKTVKNDTTNALSDIDSMLSDLNRELDQMLDYEPMSSTTRP